MLLSRSELEHLTDKHNRWHVSIYLPTERAGDEVLQNRVRFKNLLSRAEEQLVEGGLRRPEAVELLSGARGLVEDEVFWQRQSDGLAVFLADGFARKHRLPLDFNEQVVVSDRFHVKPLLQILSNNGRFYVLALSQHETRLLQGTRHQVGEIDLDDRERVPDSIIDILKWEDPEKRIQLHTGGESVLNGGVAAVFHGHGVASQDDPKGKILRYFHRLDEGVSELLAGDEAPLVPVADEFLLPLYREANSYPHLVEEGVGMEPQQLSAEGLHSRAWPVVEPVFERAEEQAREVYQHLLGSSSERASSDLEEIVPAAVFERVEGLFVAADEERWGTFEPDAAAVELHEERQPADQDLLSLAASHTMLNGGWLFVVDRERIPGEAVAAAVFRF